MRKKKLIGFNNQAESQGLHGDNGEEIEEFVSVKGLSSRAYKDWFGIILWFFFLITFFVVCNVMECEKDFGGEVRSSQKNVENRKINKLFYLFSKTKYFILLDLRFIFIFNFGLDFLLTWKN